ncbi:MAG: anthranilate synthase component I family protein [Candidatus Melainabacteria bacterium]|nr:anthranilate synthase component I family protein [Candidatus Melainabacteria bacterium]
MHQSEFALKDHNFLLETLVEDAVNLRSQHCLDSKLINQIKCFKPIRKFFSLSGLNAFLQENPEILEYPSAGIAGYVCYEGEMEFILYEEIKKNNTVELERGVNAESEIYERLRKQAKQECTVKDFSIKGFNGSEYIKKIQECQKYIEEGDIYQANISEKISWTESLSNDDIERLYKNLKEENPAPYSAFVNYSNYAILSSSPESFLKIYPNRNARKNLEIGVCEQSHNWIIESSPIKGTADLTKKNELLISEKEKAEHIMIIDLIRNDLSRISKIGSVKVSEFMEIKKFKNLFHLVSKVSSTVNEKNLLEISSNKFQKTTLIPDLEKIFSATFPGGSITGTPKIRAMEVIKKLEGVKRGPYTGSIGYFKFHEGGEFNIIIRSLVYDKNKKELSFHSGAGITSGSNPEEELKEIKLKAEKIYESLY